MLGSLFLSSYGYTSTFSAIFTKGNKFDDFVFACLDYEALPKRDLLYKKRENLLLWSKLFVLSVDLINP